MSSRVAALALAAIVLKAQIVAASVDQTRHFQAIAARQPISLDGKAGDPQWQTGVVAKDFYNLTTHRPAAPETATTVYVLYDANYLYVAFVCDQASAPITANQTTNGVGEDLDDQVEINVDTSGNGTRDYTFKTTPRGVRYQESSESNRYNPPWQAVASIGRGSWSAEMAIPLRDFRSAALSWRFNFQRRIAAQDEEFSWVHSALMTGPDDSKFWPTLEGLQVSGATTRPFPHADVYGLVSAGADRNQFQQSNGTFGFQKTRNYGADITYPFTNTLALVATGNPDFSNVEVDQQTIAPQQFQREIKEYRPFFSQGSDFLIPGKRINASGGDDEIFYTPSIGTFNWGSKIEGTIGSNAVGILDVGGPGLDDQALGLNHSSASQDFNVFADAVFARHTQDGSSVTACPGVLLTCRDDTYEFGIRRQYLGTGWFSKAIYASESGDFVGDPALGHNLKVVIARELQYSDVYFSYHDIGPKFSPVDGFTLLNDNRGPAFYTDFNGGGQPGASLKNYSGFVGGERDFDRSGQVSYAALFGSVTLNFKNLMTLDTGTSTSEQRTSIDGFPTYSGSQTLPYDQSHVTLSYAQGTASPVSVSYSWGAFATQCLSASELLTSTTPNPLFCQNLPADLFANFYLQQLTSSVSHQLGTRFNLSLELDGTNERAFSGPSDGQWLRRISLGESLGPNANFSIGLRSISGTGGFAEPGVNFSAAFHDRFPTGNELFVAFGSPASSVTLKRLIVKYILHIGKGGTGT